MFSATLLTISRLEEHTLQYAIAQPTPAPIVPAGEAFFACFWGIEKDQGAR